MWWRCSAWYLNGTAEGSRQGNGLSHVCRRPSTRNQDRLHATLSPVRRCGNTATIGWMWMIRSGGMEVVLAGLRAGTIRFSWPHA
jgi:hypothetical protein